MATEIPETARSRRALRRVWARPAPALTEAASLQAECAAELIVLEDVLRAKATGDSGSVDAALAAARATAAPLLASPRPELARQHFAASALVRLAVETDSDLIALLPAVRALHDEFALDSLDLGMRVLADPVLLELPLDAASHAVTSLVRVLAPVHKTTIWVSEPGRGQDDEAATARRELALEAAASETNLHLTEIRCWGRRCASLVLLPEGGREAECLVIAERAAALLGPAFERASLIEGNVARSAALSSSAERRLTRLGFDLHDGPLQDVAVLAGNLDTLRRRVANALGDSPLGAELIGEIEDAGAVASFLDGELRDLATSLDGTGLARQRFDNVVAGVVRKFTSRCDAEVDIEILGETDTLTESQKITLTRIVQEALANVGDHSQATTVRIAIDARGSNVQASIVDDGRGFDVEEGMLRAGRSGRMGLAGMIERVRLLGGVCEITSQPGTGTEISLTIARWEPSAATAEPEATAAAPTVLRAA